MFAIVLEYSIDLAIIQRMLEILILYVVVKIVIESRVVDSVYVDMPIGMGKGFFEEGIMPLGIDSVGKVEVF